jgi:hypothetical protein
MDYNYVDRIEFASPRHELHHDEYMSHVNTWYDMDYMTTVENNF